MELYESIRLRQSDIIEQNKASIIISRTSRVDDGAGGWVETITTLASQDVRIYAKLRYTKVVNISEAGWTVKKTQKMIAKWDADIESENETFLDTFSYKDKDYKVVDVQNMLTQNYVVFKECEIEAIT